MMVRSVSPTRPGTWLVVIDKGESPLVKGKPLVRYHIRIRDDGAIVFIYTESFRRINGYVSMVEGRITEKGPTGRDLTKLAKEALDKYVESI